MLLTKRYFEGIISGRIHLIPHRSLAIIISRYFRV